MCVLGWKVCVGERYVFVWVSEGGVWVVGIGVCGGVGGVCFPVPCGPPTVFV